MVNKSRMQQLASQGFGEASDRVHRAAVHRLQRDRAVGQGGSDLDDGSAVVRKHAGQRRLRAVDVAQVGHLGRPVVLLWGDFGERREHGGEGVVDPYVDGAKLVRGPTRGGVDLRIVRNVGLDRQGHAARGAHVVRGCGRSGAAAGEQRDLSSATG
jgi:hypothetical protein